MRQLRLLTTLTMGAMLVMTSGMCSADVLMYSTTVAPTFGANERPVTLINGETETLVHGSITSPTAVVDFSTTNDVLFNGNVNGTPAVRAEDGSINNLVLSLGGLTFTDAIFDVYGVYTTHPSLTITVNLSDGAVAQSFLLTAGQTSRNWVTIQAFNNETISSIVISDAKFYALEDTHLSFAETGVPEPSSLALVFSGLLAAGSRLRKFNRKSTGEVSL